MKYKILSPNIIGCENFLPQDKVDLLYVDLLNNKNRFKGSQWLQGDGTMSSSNANSLCGGDDFWSGEKFAENFPSINSLKNWFLHQGLIMFAERNNLLLFTMLKYEITYAVHVVSYNNNAYYGWHTDRSERGPGRGNLFTANLILNKGNKLKGGNMLFMDGAELIEIENKNNFMVIFPSFIPHSITPLYSKDGKNVTFDSQRFSIQYWIQMATLASNRT
jgi:hypothetical protein